MSKDDQEYKFIPCIEIRVSDKKLTMPDVKFICTENVADEFLKEDGKLHELIDIAQERFILLCLNIKNKLVNYSMISQGSLTSSIVHPREVLKPAILSNAASVIFVHNHPSGDPEPSMDDMEITKRLCRAFEICGISVLDHIIIGNNEYYSFKNKGLL
ncbi:MAG: JAB domain-containing protein [Actinobacteria bacterium]|nr:JAB domain-containing protein [Actinomycetota bacterium]MBU4483362.1 JAB domain-containing protein [Actinomycetota bacterium]MCG2790164.1 JAB domain-containing protein [Actinomycetes bacterium]